MTGGVEQFGWWRTIFWPIHRGEQRMILPMFLMVFLISLNYSILRNTKDALIVTANAGAEVIPFIKVWAMLPIAVLLTLIFTKLCNRFSQEHVFYIMISSFLAFYALFLFLLYPMRDLLHPHQLADRLETLLPIGMRGFIALFRNWTFTSFYVMCELWSVMVLTVLFWGFANEVTKIGEAKRFYSVFNIGSNLAAILAGQAPALFMRNTQEESLAVLIGIVIACGCITMAIFRWMNCKILNRPEFNSLHEARVERLQKKEKLSIWECFSYVANSKYLLCIAAIVVGYNLVIHIVEVVWKDELRRLHPQFNDYNVYLGDLTTTVGLTAMVLTVLLPQFIERCGWTKTALITPISMLITGIGFFSLLFFQGSFENSSLFFGASPLTALVFIGALQNISSKACKYSLLDATKEMAFIPLDHEYRLKGKAAIDGVGSRLGKSGGSILFQAMLVAFGSLSASVVYIAAILFVTIVIWILAVRSLGRQFQARIEGENAAVVEKVPPQTTTSHPLSSVASATEDALTV